MCQSIFSSLALIHIRYDIAVDLDKTVDFVSQMYPRKLELKNLLYNYSYNQGRNAKYVHRVSRPTKNAQLLLFHYVIFFTFNIA